MEASKFELRISETPWLERAPASRAPFASRAPYAIVL